LAPAPPAGAFLSAPTTPPRNLARVRKGFLCSRSLHKASVCSEVHARLTLQGQRSPAGRRQLRPRPARVSGPSFCLRRARIRYLAATRLVPMPFPNRRGWSHRWARRDHTGLKLGPGEIRGFFFARWRDRQFAQAREQQPPSKQEKPRCLCATEALPSKSLRTVKC